MTRQTTETPFAALALFDLRRGCPVVFRGQVESWFEDQPGAADRAEILSSCDTAEPAYVLMWNGPYELWNIHEVYLDREHIPGWQWQERQEDRR